MNAAAIAWIAGRVEGELWLAMCLREKRARNRSARGDVSLHKVLRRVRIVGSLVGDGEVAEGAIFGSGE